MLSLAQGAGNVTPAPTTSPDTSKRIACVAGIRPDAGNATEVWIESPRTSNRLVILSGWVHELPHRVKSRIVHARSMGRKTVEFTVAELVAIKALADKIADHFKPKPRRKVDGSIYRGMWNRYGRGWRR
jgi:hypothetical protein